MLYRFGKYELDIDRHEFRAGGELRVLEPQVFDMLRHLIENHGRLVSRDELIEVI
jgi:DNA-binding winged helix-turn-helix (wHTH) protein